jgi:hypothetical protein
MEEVIKKWELILQQDSGRDITYDRKVLEEMLIDVKQAVKNCSIPLVINQACIYEPDNTTAMNCKHCGNPKWTH